MNKKQNKSIDHNLKNRIIMTLLIISVLFLSGCSNLSSTEKEIYAVGWVLHNIDDLTPTLLEPDFQDSAIYNFSYNMPGTSPKYYSGITWFTHPSQDGAAATHIEVASPFTQTIYAYVENQAPKENYAQNFSIDRSVMINYFDAQGDELLQFAHDVSSDEYLIDNDAPNWIWDSLNPYLKEKREFTFGTTYTPTSIMIDEYNTMKLRSNLLNGKNTYLVKSTEFGATSCGSEGCEEVSVIIEKPTYEVYEDDILTYEGNITEYYGRWDIDYFNAYLNEEKNTIVNITIPSYYPIYNKTLISARFAPSVTPNSPPWIEDLDILPRFKDGEDLQLNFKAYDDDNVNLVNAYYIDGSQTIQEITLSNTNEQYSGTIVPFGEEVSIIIKLSDDSGNSQTYEIYPVSLKTQDIIIQTNPAKVYHSQEFVEEEVGEESISPGEVIILSGYAKDPLDQGIVGLVIDGYVQGIPIGTTVSKKERIDYNTEEIINEDGYFEFKYFVPIDYSGELNINFTAYSTGVYQGTNSSAQETVTRYDNDISVLDIILPENPKIGITNKIKTTIANVGNNADTFNVIFQEEWEEIESREITLEPGQSVEEEFDFTPRYGYKYYTILIESLNDENSKNDEKYDYMELKADKDVRIWASTTTGYYYYSGTSKIELGFDNEGLEDVSNINYTLELSNEDCYWMEAESCNYTLIDQGQLEELKRNEWKTINSSAELTEFGNYMIKATINSSEDQNPENNIYYTEMEVKSPEADLGLWIYSSPKLIFNETTEISVVIYNSGILSAENPKVSMYKETCPTWDTCTYELLDEKTINGLGWYEEEFINFNYTPDEIGYMTFKFIVSSDNDVNPNNNEMFVSFKVNERGPDTSIEFWRDWEQETYLINEPNEITLILRNIGTEIATNINVSLYETRYEESEQGGKPVEIYILIDSILVSTLDVEEKYDFNISYTTSEVGGRGLFVNISSDEDVEEENNQAWDYYTFVKNELDVTLDILGVASNPIINQENWGYVYIKNYGLDAENVILNIYEEDNMIYTRENINIQSGHHTHESFNFTSTQSGDINLTAEIILSGDTNISDNIMKIKLHIYNPIPLLFRIKNSNGDLINKTLFSQVFNEEITNIPGEATFVVPNITETEDNLEWGIVDFLGESIQNEDEGLLATIFNTEIEDEINITSETYDKITQDNKDYYLVFANELSIDYSVNEFIMYMPKSKLLELGINSDLMEDYDFVSCVNFDFSNRKCNNTWELLGIDHFGDYSDEINLEAYPYEQQSEAFAITESKEFNGETTNLSQAVTDELNLTIEKRLHGKIEFNEEINITRFKEDYALIENNILISSYKIKINTTQLFEFQNKPAKLLFRNIDLNNPKVNYNGVVCPVSICSSVYYNESAQIVFVNVTHFSEFDIIEGPYCGNNVCDGTETCSSCNQDCGVCPPADDDDDDSDDSEGTTPRTCVPNWNCVWGPCVDKIEKKICADINNCANNNGKPIGNRTCLIESDCVDNDGDGYGIGLDCLGPDMNDEDISITTTISTTSTTDKSNLLDSMKKYLKTLIIVTSITIGVVILVVLLFFLYKYIKKLPKKKKEKKVEIKLDDKKMQKGKDFVKQARLQKIPDSKTKKLFEDKHWKKEEIDEVMKN